ncbi:hypothetical protein INR49_024267 [Caranx melampygus]|nr:hypothetical protein INR49_024267 [Caranx melampygus]
MADSEGVTPVYFAISNIPVAFRSADLRNYFSQFVESGGFHCFHYRHRPEVLRESVATENTVSGDNEESSSVSTETNQVTKTSPAKKQAARSCCCIVSVHSKDADRFFRMYAGNHWIDSKGTWLSRRCVIKRIKVTADKDDGSFPYKTKYEQRHRVSLTERFTEADLKSLSELNPPALMQNGNVGTPVKVFLQLIQSCRLPPRLIRKLGLTFPKTSSNRRYGNVPFQYQDSCTLPATEETVLTAAGHEISGPGVFTARPSGLKQLTDSTETAETDELQREEDEDAQSNADDDDDYCEEWERHEALHDDVTSQERSKERLYEEEIELKWEKGGSGLVFYTDAQYWQEEEGDFDEQTADDWDVDMSMEVTWMPVTMSECGMKRLREGLEDRSGSSQSIGSFERFTKGVGRRVMEKQGWKDGEGLGHSQAGIPEALENEGQHPNCKRGFGYHGEKLVLHPVKKAKKDFHITTVYDKPKDIDGGDTLLRRQPNTSLKYRGWQPATDTDSLLNTETMSSHTGATPTLRFGQVVIGPPGSGKTTYCRGMQEFLTHLGRKVVVVNMDPANEGLPYSCDVDISELVTLDDVMEGLKLGPNGGLLYCMEYVEANLDWLQNKLKQHTDCYFLFDCPGQVELYTHQNSVKNIFSQLAKWNFRLTAVHLVDSHYCADPAKFISVLCTSLSTMLHVELPHVNILSKMDLVEQYGKLAFNLDFYTEVMDLTYLLDHLAADPFFKKFRHLNEKLAEVIQDYGLVSFVPLNVQDKESMIQVLRAVDKANGYCFGDLEERNLQAMMSAAVGADFQFDSTLGVQERYVEPSGKTVEEEMMDL